MTDLGIIVAASLGTWVLRASFIVFAAKGRAAAAADGALGHLRPAVLAALLATVLAGGSGMGGQIGRAHV